MFIKKFTVIEEGVTSTRVFPNGKILITSLNNSKGKTTYLRLILYALGFQVPNMKGIDFRKISFEIEFRVKEKNYILKRNGTYSILIDNNKEIPFNLPSEQSALLSYILNFNNKDIIENLLGVFYIDQDKGWSLLNRGTVIGKIKFNIEKLCAGLNDVNIDELVSRKEKLEQEKGKYQSIQNMQQAVDSIYVEAGDFDIPERINEYKNSILYLQIQKKDLKKKIDELQNLINNQQSFGRYINSLKLRLKIDEKNDVLITTDKLDGFDANIDLLNARIKLLSFEVEKLNKKIIDFEVLIKKEQAKNDLNLFETIEEKDKRLLSNIGKFVYSSQADVSDLLDQVNSELKIVRKEIATVIKTGNGFINKIYKYVVKYAEKLDVLDKIGDTEKYIFTSDLKSLSGSILSRIIFSFKLAFLKTIEEKVDTTIPFIIDSPGSKEMDNANLEKIYELIDQELQNHQVFVASIFNRGHFDKTITLQHCAIESVDNEI